MRTTEEGAYDRLANWTFLRRHNAEMERKKAEVRQRLEQQSASKNKKKGFMTPERKKKLRV